MKKKRIFIIGILLLLLIVSSFSLVGCNKSKNVKIKEIKEFTELISKSNTKIKELKFYFQRPSLRAELIYDNELNKEELNALVEDFKGLINVEFMQEIGNEYWGAVRPSNFKLYIYVDEKKEQNDYKYLIISEYNKTYMSDENPDNIDGYETWYGM